jgi:uncharacterized membrane protein YeaQ/YmgE (transglycosylase-associated protein family)
MGFSMDVPWAGTPINPFIWCAVGAAVGWLAGMIAAGTTKTSRVEDVLVGVFGAFIGGEFIAAMLNPPPVVTAAANAVKAAAAVPPPPPFTVLALALAIAGAVGMLLLLALMRKAVGPLRSQKPKSRN